MRLPDCRKTFLHEDPRNTTSHVVGVEIFPAILKAFTLEFEEHGNEGQIYQQVWFGGRLIAGPHI